MTVKKRNLFWNVTIILTVIVCFIVFVAHYKNWTKIEPDHITVVSGFYYKQLKYSELDSVLLVDKIPPMERLNGFSVLDKEKGLFREFKDSLTNKKVHVYVDNLQDQKIKMVYNDSSKLFINFSDSLKTLELFNLLKGKVEMPD